MMLKNNGFKTMMNLFQTLSILTIRTSIKRITKIFLKQPHIIKKTKF